MIYLPNLPTCNVARASWRDPRSKLVPSSTTILPFWLLQFMIQKLNMVGMYLFMSRWISYSWKRRLVVWCLSDCCDQVDARNLVVFECVVFLNLSRVVVPDSVDTRIDCFFILSLRCYCFSDIPIVELCSTYFRLLKTVTYREEHYYLWSLN